MHNIFNRRCSLLDASRDTRVNPDLGHTHTYITTLYDFVASEEMYFLLLNPTTAKRRGYTFGRMFDMMFTRTTGPISILKLNFNLFLMSYTALSKVT